MPRLQRGRGAKPSAGGGRRLGAKRPERAGPGAKGPGPALLFGGPGAAHRAAPGLPNAAAPGDRPVLSSPPGNRRRAAGGALAWGSRLPLGCAGGAAAFGGRGPTGPPACQTKERRPGPKAWAAALSGRFAPSPPPRERWNFSALSDKTPVFPPLFYEQNQRAAPDERPAGIIRWKPGKVIQLVFPRFFQKRAKGLGAEPPTGSRGGAPGGIRGGAPAPDPVS